LASALAEAGVLAFGACVSDPGPPSGGGDGSFTTKLFIEAHACTSVPSTVK